MKETVSPYFQVKCDCVQCGVTFQTSRIRPSFRKGVSQDSDFCTHYKDEVNPDYYIIRVCPHCGFAFSENSTKLLTALQKQTFNDKISRHWQKRDYGGERTWQEALETYQLALFCAQIIEESPRIIAGFLHHIAWLYRYKQDVDNEQRFLQHALDAYVQVFEGEAVELNSARLMFLIGELNRRLKNYDEAVRWFSRVVHDKKIMDSAMIKACRDMWAKTREDMVNDTETKREEQR